MHAARRSAGTDPGRTRHVVAVAVVLALLLALLALLTSLGGTSRFGDVRTGGLIDGPIVTAQPPRADPSDERGEEPPSVRPPPWLPVLAVLLVTFILALAVRALLRSGRAEASDEDSVLPVGDAEGDPAAIALDELRATALAAAEEVRADRAAAADAVVRCWERLEQQGERLGTPRLPHETSTEYGADLLRRHGADPAAVDELLHLFHRARFGHGILPSGAAEMAADALVRVAGTLRPEPHRRGQHEVGGGRG